MRDYANVDGSVRSAACDEQDVTELSHPAGSAPILASNVSTGCQEAEAGEFSTTGHTPLTCSIY